MYLRSVVFILLFALWAIVSAQYLAWNWWLGIVACLLTTYFAFAMRLVGGAPPPLKVYLKLPFYIVWLIGQIIIANLDIAKRILSPQLSIQPRWMKIPTQGSSTLTQTLYPNSITLTPGTVSVEVQEDSLEIHALTDASAAGIEQQVIARKIQWLEK